MARTPLDEAAGLTAADVLHKRFVALPADATVGEVRGWFAASPHRNIAILADDGRYAGSLTRDDTDAAQDPAAPAGDLARSGPTIDPLAPAHTAHELALTTAALRVTVVDRNGALIGVIAVTDDHAAFCGTK